jgi:hypothetical protein
MKNTKRVFAMFMVVAMMVCCIGACTAYAENTETVESTGTAVESTTTSENAPEEQTTSSEATVSTTQPTEVVEINFDGQYDGTTPGDGKFKWFSDRKIIYYDGNKVYGIVIDDGKVKIVRFAEDGESFVWEEAAESPEDLSEWGGYVRSLFKLNINAFANGLDDSVPEDAVSEVLMNQKFTAPEDYSEEAERKVINSEDGQYTGVTEGGNEFFWYNDRKVIYYDGPKVYGIVPIDDELKLVRFSEDWDSYYWEVPIGVNFSILSSSGECMYQLFVKRIEVYDEAN